MRFQCINIDNSSNNLINNIIIELLEGRIVTLEKLSTLFY